MRGESAQKMITSGWYVYNNSNKGAAWRMTPPRRISKLRVEHASHRKAKVGSTHLMILHRETDDLRA